MSVHLTFQAASACAALLYLRADSNEDFFLKLAIALLSSLSAILVALLVYVLNRRAAQRAPKTEMRAEAYRDFVIYCVCHAADAEGKWPPSEELDGILSRLVVFGESEVVTAVADFMKSSSKDAAKLSAVIEEMRGSVRTANHSKVMDAITTLLQQTSSGASYRKTSR